MARVERVQRRKVDPLPRQQRQVATAVRNAREMALLPYPHPGRS